MNITFQAVYNYDYFWLFYSMKIRLYIILYYIVLCFIVKFYCWLHPNNGIRYVHKISISVSNLCFTCKIIDVIIVIDIIIIIIIIHHTTSPRYLITQTHHTTWFYHLATLPHCTTLLHHFIQSVKMKTTMILEIYLTLYLKTKKRKKVKKTKEMRII